MALVTFRDGTATGRVLEESTPPDLPERISAREPVRMPVREEDEGVEPTGDPVASLVTLAALVGG